MSNVGCYIGIMVEIIANYEVSKREALARLSDAAELQVFQEVIPNDGVTRYNFFPRSAVLLWIEQAPRVFEAGPEAQARDHGLYLHALAANPGEQERRVFLYLPTKPECRLTPEQLAETRKRGRTMDIFSIQQKN